MSNYHMPTWRVPTLRNSLHSLLSLVMAVAVLLGYWTPALAEDATLQFSPESGKKVAARMELEINNIHIYDDMEPFYEFGGEIRLEARIWKMKQGDGCPRWAQSGDCNIELTKTVVKFSGSTNETVGVSRTLPEQEFGGRDRNSDRGGPGIGIPMYADEVYGWEIWAVDEDTIADDNMGWLVGEISQSNNWGTPGEYDERGYLLCDPGLIGFCLSPANELPYNPPGSDPAHFSVQYKLRHTPLPDLFASGFRYDTQRGAVCMRVTNQGSRPAGPFAITFRADATPSANAAEQSYSFANGLGVNESQEPCLNPLLPAGERAVSFIIDDGDHLLEGNESNNRYDSKFTFLAFPGNGAQSVAPPPNPTGPTNPVSGQADLKVTAIRVKGNVSNGSSDCDPGKKDITVAITNQGTGAATNFAVRLTVDGDENKERSVASLDAGESLDVVLDDVQLKKGDHPLTARVDAKTAVAESQEGNNELKRSIECKDKN